MIHSDTALFWPKKRRLSLRQTLALWSGGLLFTLGVILVMFINVIAPLSLAGTGSPPHVMTQSLSLRQTSEPSLRPGTLQEHPITVVKPMDVASTENGFPSPQQSEVAVTVAEVQAGVLQRVRLISGLGLLLVTLFGVVGTYWIAGRALAPLRQISLAAHKITEKTLNTRLALEGPNDELKIFSDAFDTMLDRLEHAFERQMRFVSDVAHELRTPLTTMRTYLDVLTASLDSIPDGPRFVADGSHSTIDAIKRGIDRMSRVIDDLLILASEDRLLDCEEVSLGPLLEDVVLDLSPLAAQYNVKVRFSGSAALTIMGKPALLARVFGNLIENGIRYNRSGGEVRIDLHEEKDWVVTTVEDTGEGILPEHVERIFDRFYRSERARSGNRSSFGLGLSIVEHIVRKHEGDLRVESSPGSGSRFIVRWPKRETSNPDPCT